MARDDRVGERRARRQSGAGEEHEDPELAEHQVGGVGDLPRDRSGSRHDAEAEADDERAARRRPTRRRRRPAMAARIVPDEQAGGDTEGEPDRIDFGDPSLRVAEEPGHQAELLGRSDDTDAITELEHGVVTGDADRRRPAGSASRVTPNRDVRSSSPRRCPASRRLDTSSRRKSSVPRSRARWWSLRSPRCSQHAATDGSGPDDHQPVARARPAVRRSPPSPSHRVRPD